MQVFRTDETIRAALATIAELEERYRTSPSRTRASASTSTCSRLLSLGFLIELAKVMSVGALHRKESVVVTTARTSQA